MKIHAWFSVFAKRFAIVGAALVLLISAVGLASAQTRKVRNISQPQTNVAVLDEHLQHMNPAALKSRLSRLLAEKGINVKSVKVLPNSCGCGMPDPQDAAPDWGTCFRGCMADAGVSGYALIMCGASCAAAWTGAGALVCAVCVGVSVTVIEVCALGCLLYPDGMKGPGSIMGKNLKPRPPNHAPSQAAKLKVRPAVVRA